MDTTSLSGSLFSPSYEQSGGYIIYITTYSHHRSVIARSGHISQRVQLSLLSLSLIEESVDSDEGIAPSRHTYKLCMEEGHESGTTHDVISMGYSGLFSEARTQCAQWNRVDWSDKTWCISKTTRVYGSTGGGNSMGVHTQFVTQLATEGVILEIHCHEKLEMTCALRDNICEKVRVREGRVYFYIAVQEVTMGMYLLDRHRTLTTMRETTGEVEMILS
ncbi:hypothetical protein Tco_1563436 [Tanacetum coccineum]